MSSQRTRLFLSNRKRQALSHGVEAFCRGKARWDPLWRLGAGFGNEEVDAASGDYVRLCRLSFLNLFAQVRQIFGGDKLSSKHSPLGCGCRRRMRAQTSGISWKSCFYIQALCHLRPWSVEESEGRGQQWFLNGLVLLGGIIVREREKSGFCLVVCLFFPGSFDFRGILIPWDYMAFWDLWFQDSEGLVVLSQEELSYSRGGEGSNSLLQQIREEF